MTTRAFRELSAFESVLEVANRYGVEVRMMPARGVWRAPRTAKEGPVGHYADMRARRVWIDGANHDPHDVATELHEIVHCVVVPPRGAEKIFLEHHGLMQVETALARTVFVHRKEQLSHVRGYQAITRVDRTRRIGDWDRWERTAWWRVGTRFMQRIGFLDESERPTWTRGAWPSLEELRAHKAEVDALVARDPRPARS